MTATHDTLEAETADDATDADADDATAEQAEPDDDTTPRGRRAIPWTRLLAFGVLPGLAFAATLAVGYVSWQHDSAQRAQTAAAQSVQAATDSTIAILSYRPDTVDTELPAAADRLTGDFRAEYTRLVAEVVGPGSKQQQISAAATVPAAASVSASADHAVVLVLVDQATTIGTAPPTTAGSSVRVTLDRVGGRWLISEFEPV